MRKVTLFSWPDSQKCMECVHGKFVGLEDSELGSDYVCWEACEENNGINCPAFEAKDKDDDEFEDSDEEDDDGMEDLDKGVEETYGNQEKSV